MIFEQKERSYWGIRTYDHSNFRFLDESAWPICSFARDFINEWGEQLPADKEFLSRLKSKSDKIYSSAMLELLVFALFTGAGIKIERNIASKVKTTDFTIHVDNYKSIQMECTLAANAMESIEENRKKEAVMKIVEELDDYPYYVSVDFNELSGRTLSKKNFLLFLDRIKQLEDGSSQQMSQPYSFKHHGWDLEVRLARKPEGSFKRARGFTTQPGKTIDNFKPLFTALNDKKPSKYNIGSHPYIICLGVDDMTVEEGEISDVLFGPSNVRTIHLKDYSSGILLNKGVPINKSISAVLYTNHLKVFGLNSTTVSLWHNPFANYKLPRQLFPFDEFDYTIEADRLHRQQINQGKSILEILKIDEAKYFEGLRLENKIPPEERERRFG